MTVLNYLLKVNGQRLRNCLQTVIVTLLVFAGVTLSMQMYGQEPTLIRVDTLQTASCPVFITNSQGDSLVIVDIGTYTDLRFGTQYAVSCLEENEALEHKAVVEESFRLQYEVIYGDCKTSLSSHKLIIESYKEETRELRQDNANYAAVNSQLESQKRAWRSAFLVASVIAVVEGVILFMR